MGTNDKWVLMNKNEKTSCSSTIGECYYILEATNAVSVINSAHYYFLKDPKEKKGRQNLFQSSHSYCYM